MSDMLDLHRSTEGDPYWLEFYRKFVAAPPCDRERKLAEAKAFLGTKWILHPANRVQRKAK